MNRILCAMNRIHTLLSGFHSFINTNSYILRLRRIHIDRVVRPDLTWSPSQSDPFTVSYMCQRQSSSVMLPNIHMQVRLELLYMYVHTIHTYMHTSMCLTIKTHGNKNVEWLNRLSLQLPSAALIPPCAATVCDRVGNNFVPQAVSKPACKHSCISTYMLL